MDLIKQLNKQVNEAQEEVENPFKILDIKKIRGVNDVLEGAEGKCGGKSEEEEEGFSKQQMADMKKLISQYKEGGTVVDTVGKVKGAPKKGDKVKWTEEELAEIAGNDLEMLEYRPDEIKEMIPNIIKMVKK